LVTSGTGSPASSVSARRAVVLWNVVLGVVVMLWAFDYGQVKELLSKKGERQAQKQPAS